MRMLIENDVEGGGLLTISQLKNTKVVESLPQSLIF